MAITLMTTKITFCKENATHGVGHFDSNGTPVIDASIENPCALSIVLEDGAIYLWRLNEAGDCIADTWHSTVDEAKSQAEYEFEIVEGGWSVPAVG